MGRTGSWFAYQQTPVQPDVMTLAKGLAGGVACGAMIAREDVAKSLRPGTHASTFGGNPLAMAAGCAAVRMIEEENLLENCRRMSDRFRERLEALQERAADHRRTADPGPDGRHRPDDSRRRRPSKNAMRRGVLLNATHDTVVRLLPRAQRHARNRSTRAATCWPKSLREMADEN